MPANVRATSTPRGADNVYTAQTLSKVVSRTRKLRIKMLWGIRVVGLVPTLFGSVRLIWMHTRRRPQVIVKLRSGPALGFEFPRQVVPALVVFGDYIDPEFDFLRQIARPDWVVIDIGAAIGQFSVFAAQLPASHVYAFEPSTDNINTFRQNLRRNRVVDKVSVKHMALSHTDAEMVFPTLRNPYLSRLDQPTGAKGDEIVPVRTLTRAIRELGISRVDCLKLNVAGFESEVIAGGEDFLARQGADVLVILISDGAEAWFPRIAAFGYRFFYYHPKEVRLYEVSDFGNSAINVQPWPARHIIAVSEPGIERGILRGVDLVSAPRL